MCMGVIQRFWAMSPGALFFRADGRLSYSEADAIVFDTVGDAWAQCISYGFKPMARNVDTRENVGPNEDELNGVEKFLEETRGLT